MPARNTSPPAAVTTDDHDSPWKSGLEWFFPQAIELLASRLHAKIDWSVPAQFLDKELQAIAFPGKKGRRFVDKLVQVRLRNGVDAWLLIHIEVEGRLPGRKALRRFSCRRIGRLARPVGRAGGLGPKQPVCRADHGAIASQPPPRQTYPAGAEVRVGSGAAALRLWSSCCVQLYRLIDWMIALPEDLGPEYLRAVRTLTEENKMAYVTSLERALRDEAEANILLRLIEHRFGSADEATTQRVRSARFPTLEAWLLNILDAETLEDVFRD